MPKYRRRLRGLPQPVAESVTAPPRERVAITETSAVAEAPRGSRPGRLLIKLIRAGWSLNGTYYPAEVLKRDGAAAWPKGTQAFIDHPTDEEDEARPAGSIRNLAAVLTEDARWDAKQQALVAEVRLFAPWREAITDMAEHIGMSIRAWAYGEHGEAEGRQGFVISEIAAGRSVDFVTQPAAGGAIVSILESVGARAIAEARNIGAWLESRLHLALTQLGDDMYGQGRLTRAERITLSQAIGDGLQAYTARIEADAPQLYKRDLWDEPSDGEVATAEARQVAEAPTEQIRMALHNAVRAAHGGEETYAWVRDFDPARAVVWFEVANATECRLWQQAYSIGTNGQAELSGERVEVVARTVYDPVADATAEAATTTPESSATGTPVAVVEDVTAGTPPAAPNPPTLEVPSMSGDQNTGQAPGTAGTVVLGEAERLSQLLAESRTALAEANARADKAEQRAKEAERRATLVEAQRDAEKKVREALAKSDLKEASWPAVTDRVCDSLELSESGKVDETKLTTAIEAEIQAERTNVARLLEQYGVGAIKGLGVSESQQFSEADFEAEMEKLYLGRGMSPEAAKVAAKGRV